MNSKSKGNQKGVVVARVVMFPWLAYGHITPYLELAKKLSSRGFYIYLCSTQATLSCIEKNINEKESHSIELVPLFLEDSSDLPSKFHTTNGLPHHLMPRLKAAFHNSVESFSLILQKLKPHLLIYDFLQPWAPSVAEAQHITPVMFVTSSSTMTSFMLHHFKNPDTEFPHDNIKFRDYESGFMDKLLDCAKNQTERTRCCVAFERSNKIVLIKGLRDIEGKYIDYASCLTDRKFVPVGPLVQETNFHANDDGSSEIFSWLEKKEAKSTVFVSFGSEYFLSKDDMDEIAQGLELSNVNFVWVVRFPNGETGHNGFLEKTLPMGFLERVKDKGMILEGWAPQTKILGHANIGGFVSHCGWNSVLESMKFGVPIIAMPMHLDQPINARLVEEVGVGMEVPRGKNRRLCRETVSSVIKRVVIEDDGEPVRQKAADMKEKIEMKGDQEIDEVVKELMELASRTS